MLTLLRAYTAQPVTGSTNRLSQSKVTPGQWLPLSARVRKMEGRRTHTLWTHSTSIGASARHLVSWKSCVGHFVFFVQQLLDNCPTERSTEIRIQDLTAEFEWRIKNAYTIRKQISFSSEIGTQNWSRWFLSGCSGCWTRKRLLNKARRWWSRKKCSTFQKKSWCRRLSVGSRGPCQISEPSIARSSR